MVRASGRLRQKERRLAKEAACCLWVAAYDGSVAVLPQSAGEKSHRSCEDEWDLVYDGLLRVSRGDDESFGSLKGVGPGGVEAGQVYYHTHCTWKNHHQISAKRKGQIRRIGYSQEAGKPGGWTALTFSGSANLATYEC